MELLIVNELVVVCDGQVLTRIVWCRCSGCCGSEWSVQFYLVIVSTVTGRLLLGAVAPWRRCFCLGAPRLNGSGWDMFGWMGRGLTHLWIMFL